MGRNYFIDAAKGLSIILVVANHSYLSHWFEEWIISLSMVRMPLFFFLSGIFFKFSDTPFKFFGKKFSALMKPYLVFGLFLAVILPFIGRGDFVTHVTGVVWGTRSEFLSLIVLWFLPHLFAVYCLAYLVLKNIKLDSSSPLHYGVLAAVYVAGLFMLESIDYNAIGDVRNLGLPFSIDVAFISLPLFLLGHMLRERVISFKPSAPIFGFSLGVFAIASLMGGFLDLHYRVLSEPFFVFLGSLFGIYTMLYCVFYVAKVPVIEKILVIVGKQSLFILMFHALILGFAREPLKAINNDVAGVGLTLVSICIAVIASVFAGYVIRRIMPLRILFVPAVGLKS